MSNLNAPEFDPNKPSIDLSDAPEFDPTAESVDLSGAPEFDPTQESTTVESQPLSTEAGARTPEGASAPDGRTWGQFLSDMGSAAERGAEEGTPLGLRVSEEEVKKRDATSRGVDEVIVELGSAIGVDLAATMAATWAGAKLGGAAGAGIGALGFGAGAAPGSVIGGAIGGVVGLVSYSMFSGYAQEDYASKRQDGEFKPERAAARGLLNVAPVVRHGGAITKAMTKLVDQGGKVAKLGEKVVKGQRAMDKTRGRRITGLMAQAGGEAGVAYDEFGDKGSAMFALGMSLGLHSLAYKPWAKGDISDIDESRRITEYAMSEDGADAMAKAVARFGKLDETELQYTPQKLDSEFSKYVLQGGSGSKDEMARAARTLREMGQEHADEIYSDFRAAKLMSEEVNIKTNENKVKFGKGLTDVVDPLDPNNIKAWANDGSAVAREIDRRMGTNATKTINDLAAARNHFANEQRDLYKAAITAQKLQKSARISDKEMGYIRSWLSEQNEFARAKIPPRLLDADGNLVDGKVEKAVQAWSDAFDLGRRTIEKYGPKVDAIDNYLPMGLLRKRELSVAVEDSVDFIQKKSNQLGMDVDEIMGTSSEKLASKMSISVPDAKAFKLRVRDTKRIFSKMNKDTEFNLANLIQFKKDIINNSATKRFGNDISAMFSRADGDGLPNDFREFNIRQNFLNYINGSVRSAVFAKANRGVQAQRMAFGSHADLSETRKWWDNLADNMAGNNKYDRRLSFDDKLATFRHWSERSMRSDSRYRRFLGRSAKFADDMVNLGNASFYPAVLGLNMKAMARNLTQNYMMTAPEIGGLYGYKVVSRAMEFDATKHIDRMRKQGLLGQGAAAEAVEVEGVSRAKGWINKMTKVYEATDKANRVWTYAVGHEIAKDIVKGRKSALKALEKMGPAVRSELKSLGITDLNAMKNNQDKLGDVLGTYLIGKTQLHYGAEQKAEFLRELGPMFSMFTKWPMSVGSDIATIRRENPDKYKRWARYWERYMTPLAAMGTASAALNLSEANEAPPVKYLVGNPVTWAPAISPFSFSLFNHPFWQTAEGIHTAGGAFMKQIQDGVDPETVATGMAAAAEKAGKKIAETYVPVASPVINEYNRMMRAGDRKDLQVPEIITE